MLELADLFDVMANPGSSHAIWEAVLGVSVQRRQGRRSGTDVHDAYVVDALSAPGPGVLALNSEPVEDGAQNTL